MPDTRPRRVTPEPVAQESNLGDILARAGVVPFNPNVGGADINSVIQGLLTPQPTPQPQAQPLLQQILQNLAGGISVATSRDPGAALGQQLQNQQALRFQREQYDREQSDKMNQIRQQFGLSLLNNQLEDQRQTARDNRLFDQKKEERIAAEQERIRTFNMEMAGEEKRSQWNFENQKKLADIQLNYQKSRDIISDARYTDEQKQQRITKEVGLKLDLIRSGIPAGKASSIVDKFFDDTPLTKEEENTLTAAAQRALRLASGYGSGGGRGRSKDSNLYETTTTNSTSDGGDSTTTTVKLAPSGLTKAQAFRILDDYTNKTYVELWNGQVVPQSSIKDRDVLLDAVKIKRILPQDEAVRYAKEHVLPALVEAMRPGGQSRIQQQESPKAGYNPNDFQNKVLDFMQYSKQNVFERNKKPTTQEKANYYQSQYDAALKSGSFTPEGVAKAMLEMSQGLPQEDKMVIEGIIIKNNSKKPSTKSSTKTKTQFKGNKTGAQLKKEMDEALKLGATLK